MLELVEYLAKALVDDPDPVKVTEESEDGSLLYYVQVQKSDLGKLIGKKGRTAKALRSLLSAAGGHQNLTVGMEIVEPPESDAPSDSAAS